MEPLLKIRGLKVGSSESGQVILHDINVDVEQGKVYAIMGPNGSGKSTLLKVLAGSPGYEVLDGEVLYRSGPGVYKNLLGMDPEERAREGIFLGFQYPIEIPGVTNRAFLKAGFQEVCKHQNVEELGSDEFEKLVRKKMDLLEIQENFLDREVNVGFSGGEKKRNEILQMAVLNPRIALLDEIDSGLDIDSLRVVGSALATLRSTKNTYVVITHYQRLLDYIVPDVVFVLKQGRVVITGTSELVQNIENKGYEGAVQGQVDW